ncbi:MULTISPECIES: hypothetical protein [unclassified Streptomyces]|uniref:hypothetical protein n=1 Tax=unclassified Streptomyces TaxID=2593676 RepID=UPI0032565E74
MPGTGTDVHVARGEDGTIRVATGPVLGHARAYDDVVAAGPDFTRSVLDVAGAVLVWPVLGDPGLPVAEVHDVRRAQQWLWAVYGENVAAAVHACAAGTGAGAGAGAAEPVRVRVAAELTALAGGAARLGFGHWASRWWPASYTDGIPVLEPDVLGLELAALTHRCQQLFDDFGDQPDDCVAELIAEHEAALDPLIQWWRAAPRPADTARHLENILRLIDDAADGAGLDGRALRRLRSALDPDTDVDMNLDVDLDLDLDLGQRRTAGAPVDPGALFARQGGYALAAGEPLVAGGRVIARGSGLNDWRRCPPGLVDAAEDSVSWTARALGGRRQIEVEVVAHAAAPAAGVPLVAEVQVNGGRPHRVPLARRDDVWTGRADLDLNPDPPELSAATSPCVEVGVLLPGFDPGAGPDGRADRDAIRALARRRLTGAAGPLPSDAYDTFSGPFLAETLTATATSEDY